MPTLIERPTWAREGTVAKRGRANASSSQRQDFDLCIKNPPYLCLESVSYGIRVSGLLCGMGSHRQDRRGVTLRRSPIEGLSVWLTSEPAIHRHCVGGSARPRPNRAIGARGQTETWNLDRAN